MTAFPVVEYVNSDMNILTQNWRKFLTDRYLPVSPICPSCNGIVHATTPEHVYAGHYSYLSLDGTIIPTRAFWAIENAVIAEYPSYLSKNPNAAQRYGAMGHISHLQGDIKNVFSNIRFNDVKMEHSTEQFSTFCQHCKTYVPIPNDHRFRQDILDTLERYMTEAGQIVQQSGLTPRIPAPKLFPPPLPKAEPEYTNNPPMFSNPTGRLLTPALSFMIFATAICAIYPPATWILITLILFAVIYGTMIYLTR